jgi:hypothetical protein
MDRLTIGDATVACVDPVAAAASRRRMLETCCERGALRGVAVRSPGPGGCGGRSAGRERERMRRAVQRAEGRA